MRPRNLTLTQFTNTFVPFGLLLTAALMAAETTLDLSMYRLIYSIWVSEALFIPALCLYLLPNMNQSRKNYEALLWTFAYAAYLVHFYYAVFVHYHGSLSETFTHQGARIAIPNFLVTLWWGLDVALVWLTDAEVKWIRIQRALNHFLITAVFFVSSVVIFKGWVNVLGYIMTGLAAICLLIRVFSRKAVSPARTMAAGRASGGNS